MALYTPTYPVLVYLVLVITSTTRNTIVSGEAQQFDATILEGSCPVTDNGFMQIREDIRQQLIPLIEGGNVQPATPQPSTEAVTPPPTTKPKESPVTSPPTYTCNGTPGWRRVAFINMTNPSYDCPSELNMTSGPIRTCGRANINEGCSSTTFSVEGVEYSQVCGRIRGYQVGPTSAFFGYSGNSQNINGYYVDGVSLTHGAAGSRQHIWTFAGEYSEGDETYTNELCACHSASATTPPFVGNDYFCESGRHTPWTRDYGMIYPDDPLWDGQNCLSSNTCCRLNNPPWFTKTLPSSITDDIELRICSASSISIDDTPLELIELYVQ